MGTCDIKSCVTSLLLQSGVIVFSHPPSGRPQAKLHEKSSVPHHPSLFVPIDNYQGLELVCVKGSPFGTASGLAFVLCRGPPDPKHCGGPLFTSLPHLTHVPPFPAHMHGANGFLMSLEYRIVRDGGIPPASQQIAGRASWWEIQQIQLTLLHVSSSP